MSKTKKQKKSQDTAEQSTPPEETASTTEKPSESSTGESKDDTPKKAKKASKSTEDLAKEMKCPVCGADYEKFKYADHNHKMYCGMCGTNVKGYQKSKKWGPIIEAWMDTYGPKNQEMPEGTPTCEATSFTKDGVELTCGSKHWRHDGEKLLYCGKCGTNYPKKKGQPENVKEIIEALGKQLDNNASRMPTPFSDGDQQKIRQAAREE